MLCLPCKYPSRKTKQGNYRKKYLILFFARAPLLKKDIEDIER